MQQIQSEEGDGKRGFGRVETMLYFFSLFFFFFLFAFLSLYFFFFWTLFFVSYLLLNIIRLVLSLSFPSYIIDLPSLSLLLIGRHLISTPPSH